MMKKFLSGLLACSLALSLALPIAGCKPKEDVNKGNDQNQEQQNGNQGGQGNQGNQGNQGSQGDQGSQGGQGNQGYQGSQGGQGGQSGGEGKEETPIAPGTVITDNAVKGEFYDALSTSELNGFHYSASVGFDVTSQGETTTRKIVMEGAVMLSGDELGADLYLSHSAESEEAGDGYFLCFVRGNTLYTASGEWDKEGEVDFNALKEQLKAEKNRLLLERTQDDQGYVQLAKSQTVYKILKNMPAIFDGVLTKTEGGYTLSFDVGKSVGTFLQGLRPLAEAFDKNHDLSIGGLFKEESVKTLLETLFKGVTAEELVATIKPVLPETLAAALPKPVKAQKASDYADGLLRSGAFYQELTKEKEGFEKWKTFAEMPLKELLGLLTGSEFTFEPSATERFDEFVSTLKTSLINTLFDFAGIDEGKLSDEMLQVSMTFAFDEEKHLLGFSADALAEGSKTAAQPQEGQEGQGGEDQQGQEGQEGQEDENGGMKDKTEEEESEKQTEKKALENAKGDSEEPEDGSDPKTEPKDQGTDTETEPKDENKDEGKDEGKDDAGTGAEEKTSLRGTVKLEASGASSPALFDLTGCKYRSGEDETATIRAKK